MDEEILARLERIERRLDALEGRSLRPAAPVAADPPPLPSQSLEAELGTRWLPRVGAVAVIGAIAYLVGLGLRRGLITPEMVLVAIAVACTLVAVLGARLRGDRESFGNVLVGLAAGGLYVDVVGAHLYRELLGGEATVAGCVAISLATVAFGARRGLPPMLGVGLFGGLLAALTPLSKGALATSAGLIILVSAPSFGVSATRRWSSAVAASWGATAFVALAVLFSDGPLSVRLLPLDATLLMSLAAWAFATERPQPYDPLGTFPLVAAAATGGASLAKWSGPGGMAHVAVLGVVVGLLGLGIRGPDSGRRVATSGLILLLVVAPLGAGFYEVPVLLASLSFVETVAFRRRLAPIVAVQSLLAAIVYPCLLLSKSPESPFGRVGPWEPWLILLLAASSIAAAWAVDRPEARVAVGVAIWGLATRLAFVGSGFVSGAMVTAAWIATFAGLLALGFARRRPELRHLGLVVVAATAGKVMLVDLAGLDAATKAGVLLAFGVVLLGAGYVYVRWVGLTEEGPARRP